MNSIKVTLKREIPDDKDGLPTLRHCWEHETLMSFNDDSGNHAFNVWWDEIGQMIFSEWYNQNWDGYSDKRK